MNNDAILLVDEELPSRIAVKEFLRGMYRDAAAAVPAVPVLSGKKQIET